MILGLGSDITDARRVAKVIERHGERFLARIFTAIYFAYFILMPWYTRAEKTKAAPERVTYHA